MKLLIGERDLSRAARPKSLFTDKRKRGVVVLIAGSKDYHGAPSLAARAAQSTIASLRVGAGYAVAYVPSAVAQLVRSQSPAIIVNTLGREHIVFNDRIKRAVEKADAVAIGMGIGKSPVALRETAKILDLCFASRKKTVIDADAIHAVKYTRRRMNSSVMLTPQEREFKSLSGRASRGGASTSG